MLDLVRLALNEDIGPGDATSMALIPEAATARAHVVARGACVVCGGAAARIVFATIEESLSVNILVEDGHPAEKEDVILEISGPARGILTGERTALNFMQRLTGTATLTAQFVSKAAPYGMHILDTRKTTPAHRKLEKYAVRCGGGENHRFGLYDRIMIKDNHRAFCASASGKRLVEAVAEARCRFPDLLVEIESETVKQCREALRAKPDWMLLDNMTAEDLRTCVSLCAGACKIEASGDISLDRVEEVAAAGVDAISVGRLTHSAEAVDLSLEFITK